MRAMTFGDSSITMQGAPSSYFDNLAADERHIIARKLSDSPLSSQWRRHLTPSTMHLLFDPQGPFRNDLGGLFPVLSIGWKDDFRDDELSMMTEEAETLKALENGGIVFKHLVYRTQSNLYRRIPHVGANLKSLELTVVRLSDHSYFPWAPIIMQFSSSLERLVLDSCCHERPSFSGTGFPNLKELGISDGIDCAHLIQELGENVESFVLMNWAAEPRQVCRVLEVLPSNCTKLREIELPHFFVSDVTIGIFFASCLVPYRAQLRKATTEFLFSSLRLCTQVLEACSNLFFATQETVHVEST